ncbi:MAG TPA: EAL domain-containing protein [Solirubrobacteraceae bacterium]|nr:EAL domain-containing protein [Solirubrobacteraceae bacterium]
MSSLVLERDVLSLSTPAVVVPAELPCPDVELVFAERPELSSVVVELPDGGCHVLTRRRLSLEMAGRLGYGRALHANQTVGALTGGEPSLELAPGTGLVEAGRRALARKPGRRYDDLLVRAPDGRLRTVVVVDLLQELAGLHEHRASHDELTGLLNRAGFVEAVATAFDDGAPGAVLFVDLDDFKAVNDSLGHPAGDVLLQDVAARLKDAFRASDVVARLGGDEFAVLLGAGGEEEAARAAERALLALSHPVVVGGESVRIGASVGIALASDAEDADALLRNADLAMYDAKQSGKARAGRYRPALHDRARARLELRSDLPSAIERGELLLHYQPVVDLGGSGVRGVEALVRWQHPTRGLIPPLEFLPLAEQSGAVVQLGAWVLDEACRQVAAWARPLHLAVNVSVVQLEEPGFAARVLAVVARHGLPVERLTLEITESAFARETALVLATLHELADAGVCLAIDDFGTGYSSFSRLDRLPVGMLKIDRSFTVRATPASSGVLRGMLGLADALGLQVLVEGVETPEQADLIRTLGGRLAQGYLFARPLPPDELEALLAYWYCERIDASTYCASSGWRLM